MLANPGLGDVEIWELREPSGGWFHPVHIHLVDFKILDRNGRPPFAVRERAEGRRLRRRERDRAGDRALRAAASGSYMMHCHNLVHEDHDMMLQFEVGKGGPDPITSDPAKPLSALQPL